MCKCKGNKQQPHLVIDLSTRNAGSICETCDKVIEGSKHQVKITHKKRQRQRQYDPWNHPYANTTSAY